MNNVQSTELKKVQFLNFYCNVERQKIQFDPFNTDFIYNKILNKSEISCQNSKSVNTYNKNLSKDRHYSFM